MKRKKKKLKKNKSIKSKTLKLTEEFGDKSTLPTVRKGVRNISPEVVEI